MFTTIEDTKAYTGYDVTGAGIVQAQGIIEAYIGRAEVDVDDPRDLELLDKATAYQAAYMKDNYAKVFQQVAAHQILQNGNMIRFNPTDSISPWIAPLARITLDKLTWRRTRSIMTGRILPRRRIEWRNN